MSAAPPEVALEAMEATVAHQPSLLAGLQELEVPIVTINSDSDDPDIEAFERYGVKVVLMSGVGHFLMMEDPDAFNRLLGELIEAFREAGIAE